MDFDNIMHVEYLRYNNYKSKMKLVYSSKAVMPRGGGGATLMYTLFVLIYDLLYISHKSLTLLTAKFLEWNMKEDTPGYALLPLMCTNTSRYFFLTHQNLNYPHIEHLSKCL